MIESTPIYTSTAAGHDYLNGDAWHHHKKRFSWQPIVAGIAAALAVQVVLSLIGIGLGLGMTDTPGALPWQEKPTTGALMWAGASLLASAFYGGFIAARLTKSSCHHEGALSGIVAWAGSVLLVLFLLSNSYGHLFGGASQIMGHMTGPHYAHMGPGMGRMTPPPVLPGSAVNTEMLNQQSLNNPPAVDAARVEEDKAAAQKAALAAGVVLLLAAFVSGLGGVLGAAHVKHHREHHEVETTRTL